MHPVAKGRYFEGPRWHRDELWCVDSLTRTLYGGLEKSSPGHVAQLPGIPGGMGFLPDGSVIVTSMFDRRLLRVENGHVSLYRDLSQVAAGTIDDMIVDEKGRTYVGDLGFDLTTGADPGSPVGRIILVTRDGTARAVADGLRFPNGIAISGDGRELVVAETNGDCLARYQIQEDASLAFKDRIGHFGEPDGICIDEEDAVWVSLFGDDAFVRIDRTGKITHRIAAVSGRAVACVLGGQDRRVLYCLSADTTHKDLMRGRSASRIDAVSVDVPGTGFP